MKANPTNHARHQHNPHRGSLRWLTTFNDLITLLMVFFVLLFTMGSMDVQRFKNFQNALQSAMGVLHEGRHAPVGLVCPQDTERNPMAVPSPDTGTGQDRLKDLIATPGLEAEYTSRGIELILNDNLLFASGSDALTPSGVALLSKVAQVIDPLGRYVRVEGHTDNIPIANLRFASNWELSMARAIQVVKYLAGRGGIAPEYLSAAGYGQTRPRVPNNSAIHQSRNRRVEIILGQVAVSPVSVLENNEERRN